MPKHNTTYYRDKLRVLRDEMAEASAAKERRRLALLTAERCTMLEISRVQGQSPVDWRHGVKPLKKRV